MSLSLAAISRGRHELRARPSHRKVTELGFARECVRPDFIPVPRPKQACAVKGLRYEKAFLSALRNRYPEAVGGQWFEFRDCTGNGWCQVDGLLYWPPLDAHIIFECKLTDTIRAWSQLRDLYLPIVQFLYGRAFGIVVARNLTPESRCIHSSLESALGAADFAAPTLHWRGGPSL